MGVINLSEIISLSSGCFINHEKEFSQLSKREIPFIELSGHNSDSLKKVIPIIEEKGINISSIHAPCPKLSHEINLAVGDSRKFEEVKNVISKNLEVAHYFKAPYVVIHAFYCLTNDFAASDIERAKAFETIPINNSYTLNEYRNSEIYQNSILRTINNLKKLIPELKKEFPNIKILLENLNPRFGYGGICLEELRTITTEVDGEVGICLDLGHLALVSKLVENDIELEIKKVKDLVLSAHVHQNFMGEYFVDRKWNMEESEFLQETDIHFPLLAKYNIIRNLEKEPVSKYNSFLSSVIKGCVQYSSVNGNSSKVAENIRDWLKILNRDTLKVLEYDSRFAPLDFILWEYQMANEGLHPLI